MRSKQTNTAKVIKYVQNNPLAKPKEVATATKVPINTVYQTIYNFKKAALKLGKSSIEDAVKSRIASSVKDLINSPTHYTVGGVETIDFIEAKKLDYNLGNVVKYVSRANYKDSKIENLKKAQWYLNRAVAKLEGVGK